MEEDDNSVTMVDVLKEQEAFEEDANAVLGASDDKNCTYSLGYVKRQALYACLTCCPDSTTNPECRAGICLACSLACHENHNLVELYTKRNFQCDCAGPKFPNNCTFNSKRLENNEQNEYNQNFSGLYCTCQRPYPDPDDSVEDEMIQCIICEDWFHSRHLNTNLPTAGLYSEMICEGCTDKNDFLENYMCYEVGSHMRIEKTSEQQDVDVDKTNESNVDESKTVCDTSLTENNENKIADQANMQDIGDSKASESEEIKQLGEHLETLSNNVVQAENNSTDPQTKNSTSLDVPLLETANVDPKTVDRIDEMIEGALENNLTNADKDLNSGAVETASNNHENMEIVAPNDDLEKLKNIDNIPAEQNTVSNEDNKETPCIEDATVESKDCEKEDDSSHLINNVVLEDKEIVDNVKDSNVSEDSEFASNDLKSHDNSENIAKSSCGNDDAKPNESNESNVLDVESAVDKTEKSLGDDTKFVNEVIDQETTNANTVETIPENNEEQDIVNNDACNSAMEVDNEKQVEFSSENRIENDVPIEENVQVDEKPVEVNVEVAEKLIEDNVQVAEKPIEENVQDSEKPIEDNVEVDEKPIEVNVEVAEKLIEDNVQIAEKQIEDNMEVDEKPIEDNEQVNEKPIEDNVQVDEKPIEDNVQVNEKPIEDNVQVDEKPIEDNVQVNEKPIEDNVQVNEKPIEDNVQVDEKPIEDNVQVDEKPVEDNVPITEKLIDNNSENRPSDSAMDVDIDNQRDLIAGNDPEKTEEEVTTTADDGNIEPTGELLKEIDFVIDNSSEMSKPTSSQGDNVVGVNVTAVSDNVIETSGQSVENESTNMETQEASNLTITDRLETNNAMDTGSTNEIEANIQHTETDSTKMEIQINDSVNGTHVDTNNVDNIGQTSETIGLSTENDSTNIETQITNNLDSADGSKTNNVTDIASRSDVENETSKDCAENNFNAINIIPIVPKINETASKRKQDEEYLNGNHSPLRKKIKQERIYITECIKPVRNNEFKRKGATFWPSDWRSKLCSCRSCLDTYNEKKLLFILDLEDTVIAYEDLGKIKAESSSSQYEQGMEALSSLGHVQQINAITEYNRMKEKLLEFLKTFKDKKEVVKEEDIKGFFAGMKPKREPDGVYFCR